MSISLRDEQFVHFCYNLSLCMLLIELTLNENTNLYTLYSLPVPLIHLVQGKILSLDLFIKSLQTLIIILKKEKYSKRACAVRHKIASTKTFFLIGIEEIRFQ